MKDWADRIFYLGYRAYPSLEFDDLQRLAVTRFCQGCWDKAAGQSVIALPLNKPKTMNDAVLSVQWYVLNHKVIYGKKVDSRQVS